MALYKYLLFLAVLIISIICQKKEENFYINNNNFAINNAVYIIKSRDGELYLDYTEKPFFRNDKQHKKNINYLLTKDKDNEEYYYIKEISSDTILASNEEDKIVRYSNDANKDYALWKITPKVNEQKQLIYYVQNKKSNKYWFCENSYMNDEVVLKSNSELNKNNEFQFIEIYKEKELKESSLLEKEPIDVVIKYINLKDPSLNRNSDIEQVKKHEENGEIIYSVRSILQNMPWVRKIFILMPNNRVKYFKTPEKIRNKIIYIKDKDLIGFDSASSNLYRFNLFKMKNFGISENFILMEDNYFIAKPLKKSEFFYEENGKILPYIIANDYEDMNKSKLENKFNSYLSNRYHSYMHPEIGFDIIQKRTLLLMYQIFGDDDKRNGKKLIQPIFNYNVIPIRGNEIEEIYRITIDTYDDATLFFFSLVKSTYDLHMNTFYMTYVKNKYDRKVSKISGELFDLFEIEKIKNTNVQLFAINISEKEYNSQLFDDEKFLLESLFPNKSPFELDAKDEQLSENKINKEDNNNNNNDNSNKYDNNKNSNNNNNNNNNNIEKDTKINEDLLSKTKKKVNDRLSSVVDGYDHLIDKVNVAIDKTIENDKLKDNDNDNKKKIYDEVQTLKKESKWRTIRNFSILLIILLFIIYMLYRHFSVRKYKNYVMIKKPKGKKKYKNQNHFM